MMKCSVKRNLAVAQTAFSLVYHLKQLFFDFLFGTKLPFCLANSLAISYGKEGDFVLKNYRKII